MTLKIKLIAALCCFSSAVVFAGSNQEKWVAVSGDSGSVYSVELSSIKSRGAYVSTWSQREFSQVQKDGFIGYGMVGLYDCANGELAIVQLIGFRDSQGGRPGTADTFEPKFTMPPPGSSNAQMLDFVCAYSKSEEWALTERYSPFPVLPSSLLLK